VVAGHAYSLITTRKIGDIRLVQLRNPWGSGEWTGPWSDRSNKWKEHPDVAEAVGYTGPQRDGSFWMSAEDFLSVMNVVRVQPKEMPEKRASHNAQKRNSNDESGFGPPTAGIEPCDAPDDPEPQVETFEFAIDWSEDYAMALHNKVLEGMQDLGLKTEDIASVLEDLVITDCAGVLYSGPPSEDCFPLFVRYTGPLDEKSVPAFLSSLRDSLNVEAASTATLTLEFSEDWMRTMNDQINMFVAKRAINKAKWKKTIYDADGMKMVGPPTCWEEAKFPLSVVFAPSIILDSDTQDKVAEAFKSWDTNGDGVITEEEMATVFTGLNSELTSDAISKMFKAADINSDGEVKYEEFLRWLFSEG